MHLINMGYNSCQIFFKLFLIIFILYIYRRAPARGPGFIFFFIQGKGNPIIKKLTLLSQDLRTCKR
jgi:hypothetical protein